MTSTDPFVTPRWLGEHPDALLFDCRHYYDGRVGRDQYVAGHIPGARFVSLDDDLAGTPGPAGEGGNSPLPTPGAFTVTAQRLGIHQDSVVVLYDDGGGYIAGRMWWMLDSVGVEAYVLAGGIAAWPGELAVGPDTGGHRGGTFTMGRWPADRFVAADEVAAADGSVVVLDSRAHERYVGDGDRQGHIPGALSAPATGNLHELQPLSETELRTRFEGLGIEEPTPVIAYCGAGVSAGLNLLALRRAGHGDVRLYVGSWSEWSSDPSREVASGA